MWSRLCAIALTLLAVAGAPAIANAAPAEAALTCWTTTYNTVGNGTCRGSGYWKTKVTCAWEPARSSSRIYQSRGTVSQYASCAIDVTGTYVEIG